MNKKNIKKNYFNFIIIFIIYYFNYMKTKIHIYK